VPEVLSFDNKSILVTAGGSGIGGYIAASFSESGARVHIVDLDVDALDKSQAEHPEYVATQGDVSREEDVEKIFSRHFDLFDGIDVLVNCAGIAGPTAMAENVSIEEWRNCFSVNLDGTFMCSRQVIPAMKKQLSGRIINISSTAGWHGYPLRTPYSSSKWAVVGFTKSLAMELGQYGVTANVICPGSVDGDRMDRVIAAEAREKGVSEQEIRKSYTSSCSMRTFISGQDIADMAIFLASDSASKVTGQIMNVDGHMENFAGLDDLFSGSHVD
jgi:NAD(P)-dependent dehydrogenase (short-subunit alcohol dehydrogenase family)